MQKIVEFKDVSKIINKNNCVSNLDFTIYKGDILGYIGPNGAGKTTTIRLMLDLLKPSSGKVIIKTSNIGFVLDVDGLYVQLTAMENLMFFDKIFNDHKNRRGRLDKLLHKVDLYHVKDKKVWEFSKGMKKRLCLARALLQNPDFLIMDEPMNGLDPEGQLLIKNIITEISKANTTIFLSSHNLSKIQNLCNKIAIINEKILVFDKLENLIAKSKTILNIKVKSHESIGIKIINEIKQNKYVKEVQYKDGIISIVGTCNNYKNSILNILINNNIIIENISEPSFNLEEYYLNVIGGEKYE